ncbi:MAG: hypothetical protein JKX69_15260 [Rhodobacteraceae bacterium]|nr:hypothetical protein [Paracoccaceae bacterium]
MVKELFLPALALVALGWLVPQVLARLFSEGVGPLIWLGVASTVILLCLSSVGFYLLYVAKGMPLFALTQERLAGPAGHFLRLGGLSAMFWGPIMLLSVARLPRRWKEVVW